ncbi:MAG: hypothetical protein QOI55_868 [Actinomycetota bacterium]|nr:hypothetical protein [Actinomycetota bacterium]
MRLRNLAIAAVLAVVAIACTSTGPPPGTSLPDLAMPQILGLAVSNPAGGTHALKFSTTVVNIGEADFRLRATRPDTNSNWTVSQVLPDGRGALVAYPTNAGYVYGGDGHNHWHVKYLASYRLYTLPDVTAARHSLKTGFCFFDTTPYNLDLPGSPQAPIYNSLSCGAQTATSSTMGLSIGWGDTYPKGLPGQEVDITGLAAGDYRLRVMADEAANYFEKTRANNANWTDFRLSYDTDGTAHIQVLAQGPQP